MQSEFDIVLRGAFSFRLWACKINELQPGRRGYRWIGPQVTAAALLIAIISASSAWCQSPPVPNFRKWPISGDWYVVLVRARSLAGRPACLMMAGYSSHNKPDKTWGVRAGGDELMLITNSKWPEDVAGPEMEVSVDGYDVGRFKVTDRPLAANDMMTAAASVMDAHPEDDYSA